MPSDHPASHPFLEGRPPTMDYFTYLTLLENSLDRTNMSVLEDVLRDDAAAAEPTLLINIGWDLIAILLPLLPESAACLDIVARAGNPRECVLKAGEAMGMLVAQWDDEDEQSEDDNAQGSSSQHPALRASPSDDSVKRLEALIGMLITLHPRIRTKRPSRFIQTTLKIALAAVRTAGLIRLPAVLPAVMRLVSSLSPRKKPPALPPRRPSGDATSTSTQQVQPRGADPEADASISADGDTKMTIGLLQAAVTFAAAGFVRSVDVGSSPDLPGFGWSPAALNSLHAELKVPGGQDWEDKYKKEPKLKQRQDGMKLLVDTAEQLGLDMASLLASATGAEATDIPPPSEYWPWDEDMAPEKVDDVKLSPLGSLHVLGAALATGKHSVAEVGLDIFPQVQALFDQRLPTSAATDIDMLLALPLMCLEADAMGELPQDIEYATCLQTTSALAATASVPALRQAAHVLTSTLLRSHPEPGVRLGFIKEAMSEAPFENLKPVAVGWLKGEIIEANADAFRPGPLASGDAGAQLFASPLPLHALSSVLFPDLTTDVLAKAAPLSQKWQAFQLRVSFYLAVVNFYYLLLKAPKTVRDRLDVGGIHRDADVGPSFLGGLRDAVSIFRVGLGEGEGENAGVLKEANGPENTQLALGELLVVEDALERVEGAVKALGTDM